MAQKNVLKRKQSRTEKTPPRSFRNPPASVPATAFRHTHGLYSRFPLGFHINFIGFGDYFVGDAKTGS